MIDRIMVLQRYGSGDGEIILDYLGGLNVITNVLIREKQDES